MADTFGTVTAKVRAHLNDMDAQLYADSFLLTYVGMAQSQLDAWLRSKGVEYYRLRTTLTVPAGTTVLSATSVPALPSDFGQPVALHERTSGSTVASEWQAMTQVRERLPDVEQSDRLQLWCWQAGQIQFVGATTAREVRIEYLSMPEEADVPADALPVRDSAEAVAYLTASLVTHAAGELEMAQSFRAQYQQEAMRLYDLAMRQAQRRVLRRKFYYPGPSRRLPYIT